MYVLFCKCVYVYYSNKTKQNKNCFSYVDVVCPFNLSKVYENTICSKF